MTVVQLVSKLTQVTQKLLWQDYRAASKMSVDIDATPDLLLLIQQKLVILQYRYGSLSDSEG